ncbi:MAG: hypothetical protein KME46_21815 [Brasilonema angustatum HA4187-MV1]|jgi:phage N-6-adenine-methyltransferase|nr:hypothetical protein [Brasilonema angustatum HA4187-MV1]
MLGDELRKKRKAAKLSIQALATQTHLAYRTIWNFEQTGGRFDLFLKAITVLALEIEGRNLPEGTHLGEQLKKLRQRRKLSQRKLCELADISRPALIALEKKKIHHLAILDKVGRVLGAGLYLKPVNQAKSFYTHAGNATGQDYWQTPLELLSKLYQVFGTFDLDPCSGRNKPVKAKVHFLEDDDGLSLPWFGAVFVNPPYNQQDLKRWILKALTEHQSGNTRLIVVLVPARTDTRWWHQAIAQKADILFLKGRLRFGGSGSDNTAPFPSALALYGASDIQLQQLATMFPESWLCRR